MLQIQSGYSLAFGGHHREFVGLGAVTIVGDLLPENGFPDEAGRLNSAPLGCKARPGRLLLLFTVAPSAAGYSAANKEDAICSSRRRKLHALVRNTEATKGMDLLCEGGYRLSSLKAVAGNLRRLALTGYCSPRFPAPLNNTEVQHNFLICTMQNIVWMCAAPVLERQRLDVLHS